MSSSSSTDAASRHREREELQPPHQHPKDGGAAPPATKKAKPNSKSPNAAGVGGAATVPPITQDGERPQKRFYRQRAHCNPLSHNDSYEYPISPSHMQWTNPETGWLYPVPDPSTSSTTPEHSTVHPTVLDIGCGFGGLLMSLATVLPHERILGLEIRAKVTEYVRLRIVAARHTDHTHHNAAVLRTNSMKFLVNYFAQSSIHKIFICFPDPHFKRKNHPRRIITTRLLDEYAYVLSPHAKLYCITDVHELHDWHVAHCEAHPLFRRIVVGSTCSSSTPEDAATNADDPCIALMIQTTEEGQKVERNQGDKYYAVYERIPDTTAAVAVEVVHADNFFRGA